MVDFQGAEGAGKAPRITRWDCALRHFRPCAPKRSAWTSAYKAGGVDGGGNGLLAKCCSGTGWPLIHRRCQWTTILVMTIERLSQIGCRIDRGQQAKTEILAEIEDHHLRGM
jgi:hypothetical protein